MNTKAISSSVGFVILVVIQATTTAAEPVLLPPVVRSSFVQDAGAKGQPKVPDPEKKPIDKKPIEKKLTEPPQTDVFDQSVLPSNNLSAGFNPHMMGDFPGNFARQRVTVFGILTTTTTTTTVIPGNSGNPPTTVTITRTQMSRTPTPFSKIVYVPVASAGAFKIAEKARPRPVDRVFATWNYFDGLRGPSNGANDPTTITQRTVIPGPGGGTTSIANFFIPGAPNVNANLHRETFGFEKTFLDGNASIEVRIPFAQMQSNVEGFAAQNVGDMTIIGKYAFFNDRPSGNVFSVGLAVTAPTGPGIDTINGHLHSTLLQPWFGYIWNADRFFVHAFHSVVVPSDSRDVTLLFNDVGLNYWLYRGDSSRFISSVVPMIEAHVTTPMSRRDDSSPIYAPDLVVLTGGVHLGFFRNTRMSLGVATPVNGPRAYNAEGFVQLNWRR